METLTRLYLLISALGIGDAIYTGYEYSTQNFTSCSINQQFSCGGVFASGHTAILGIPFYILGLIWFPILFILGLYTSGWGKSSVNSDILLPVLMVGNMFTVYLWYLELVVIGIICPLCVSLYAVNYALTGLVLYQFAKM